MKYRVFLETTASLAVVVDVSDELDDDGAREAAINKAFDAIPRGICAQCSGWGETWSRDDGEWEIAENPDGTEVQPERVD